jgi:hypothetical protein
MRVSISGGCNSVVNPHSKRECARRREKRGALNALDSYQSCGRTEKCSKLPQSTIKVQSGTKPQCGDRRAVLGAMHRKRMVSCFSEGRRTIYSVWVTFENRHFFSDGNLIVTLF